MSAGQYSNTVEEVRKRSDIVHLIGEYMVLKKAGRYFKGLCPFHNEKTPSFHVDPDKQLFHCFGCGTGGDIFTFVEKIEGLDFLSAVKHLSEKYGIPISIENTKNPGQDLKKQILKLNQLAAQYYRYLLQNAQPSSRPLQYLQKRGISGEIIELFYLGYSPPQSSFVNLMQKRNISYALGEKAGLIIKGDRGYYDRFRGRIIFPIHDYSGQVIGFGGRLIGDGQPKYLNSPESAVYSKSRSLYGLNHAKETIRRTSSAIVVEGYFDVISAIQHGVKNTVASLGTAFTAEQAKLLKRYAQTVYIAYDADTAGQAATLKGLSILVQEGLEVKVVILPGSDDPDSFLQREGGEAFQELMHKSLDLETYRFRQIIARHDLNRLEGKKKALYEIVQFIYDLKSPLLQEEFLLKASGTLGVSEEILRQEYYQFKKQKQISLNHADYNSKKRDNKGKEKIGELLFQGGSGTFPRAVSEAEEIILKIIFENQAWRSFIFKQQLSEEDFVRPECKKIFREILATPENPLCIVEAHRNEEESGFISSLLLREIENDNLNEKYILDLLGRIREYNIRQRLKALEKEITMPELQNDRQRLSEKLTELSSLKLKLSKDFSSFLST